MGGEEAPVRVRLTGTDKSILRLAIPAMGSLLIDPLLTLADAAFVARLGTVELAALGVSAAILIFAFFLFHFLSSVLAPLVAKALGKGNLHEAKRWVGNALFLSVVLGVIVTALLVVFAPVFVDWMGATAEVAGPAVTYMQVRAVSVTAVLVTTVGHGAFRGHKDTVTPLKVGLVVNAVNLVLDPILIFGFGWGLAGAAVASVFAQVLGAIWFLRLIIGQRMASRPERFTEFLPSLFTLIKNGAQFTTRAVFIFLAFTVAASTATRIGTAEIAAHHLVVQLFFLSALLADAFAFAAQPLVAETAAKRDLAAVNSLVGRLLRWGLLTGLVLAIVVAVGRYALPLLSADPTVGELALAAGAVAALMVPLTAVVFVLDGVFLGFLGLGTLVVSGGAGALVAVALMLMTEWGQTLNGIWWAIAVMMAVRLVVFALGYRRSAEIAVRP